MKPRLFLILVLLLLSLPVGAQDTRREPPLSGIFVQVAGAGSFDELDDGTFLLTLYEVDDFIPWESIAPALNGGEISPTLLGAFWESVAGLSTSAMLVTEELAIELMIVTSGFFDPLTETMEFTVALEDVYTITDNAPSVAPELPDEFGEATLFINYDRAFVDSLHEAASNFPRICFHAPANCSLPPLDTTDTPPTPIAHIGVLVNTVEFGELQWHEDDDDSYLLILEEVPEQTPWEIIHPEMTGGIVDTQALIDGWAANDNFHAVAMLQSTEFILELRVSAPEFDDEYGAIIFEAELVRMYDAFDLSELKDPPEWFEEATLFILLDEPLLATLAPIER